VIRGVRNIEGEREYDKVEKAFKTEIIAMPAMLETIRHTTDEYEDYDPKSENDTKSENDESTVISHAPSEQPSTDPTQKHRNTEENYDYFKADYVLDDELINEKLNINSDAQETTGNAQIQ
jgi:hypothetical protein